MKYERKNEPEPHQCPLPGDDEAVYCTTCRRYRRRHPGGFIIAVSGDSAEYDDEWPAARPVAVTFAAPAVTEWDVPALPAGVVPLEPAPARRASLGPCDREAAHRCPDPPGTAWAAVFCETCRVYRQRQPDGSIATASPGQAGAANARQLELDRRQLLADNRELARVLRDRDEELAERAAENRRLHGELHPPAPEEGSAQWWAQTATEDDLDPGWWGQPDIVPGPDRPAGACTECRLPWPAPDSSGRCRYCRAALEQHRAALAAEQAAARVRARMPARVAAAGVLLFLRLLGALVCMGWGYELLAWAARALF